MSDLGDFENDLVEQAIEDARQREVGIPNHQPQCDENCPETGDHVCARTFDGQACGKPFGHPIHHTAAGKQLRDKASEALEGLRAHYGTLQASMKVVEPHLANLPAAAQAAARQAVRQQFTEKFEPIRLAIEVLEEIASK